LAGKPVPLFPGVAIGNDICATPRSRVLMEKPAVAELVKEFPGFYGTRRFNTAFSDPYPESDESNPHLPALFISSSPISILFIYEYCVVVSYCVAFTIAFISVNTTSIDTP
jgi:hypothetical protein